MEEKSRPQNAVLVGLQLPRVEAAEVESSLVELDRLVTTLGYHVVGRLTQKQSSTRKALFLGEGKLRELASWTGGSGVVSPTVDRKKTKAALKWEREDHQDKSGDERQGNAFDDVTSDAADEREHPFIMGDIDGVEAGTDDGVEAGTDERIDGSDDDHVGGSMGSSGDREGDLSGGERLPKERAEIVFVDHDLSPSQMRNLESALGVRVVDRTGVIIEIFSRHARTRAARLQVEIARLTYLAPRLRETGGGEDRQGGGIGAKGAGESKVELDRRKIRDRIKELKEELESIGHEHLLRRARRQEELSVALVGYTNAGKSSLMRAMTGSEVLVADQLFATLDTTVRPMYPESKPKILLSDTVGFIKRLPHDLVASFRSTLEEAKNASLLLYVVDASDPAFRSQLEVSRRVLGEVGATEIPELLVLNKRDRLAPGEEERLTAEFPEAILVSTRDATDLARLRERILRHFEKEMIDEDVFIPYSARGVIGEVRARARVLKESYDENGVVLRIRAPEDVLALIKRKMAASSSGSLPSGH